MGHPIHKHMSGRAYDAKEAYNKDLSDSARLHYLENDEHDKGMSRKAAGMKPGVGSIPDAPNSRNSSPASNMQHDSMEDKAKHQHMMKEHPAKPPTSRYSSPANNVSYGDISGKTGYIGEQRADDMKYNPVDDRAGMSRHSNYGNSPANGIGDTLKKIGRTGTRMLGDIGTQVVDMLTPDPGSHSSGRRAPGATSYAEKDYRKDKEMAHYQKSRDLTAQGKTYFNLSSAFDDDGQGSHMFNSGTPKQSSSYGGKGMKRVASASDASNAKISKKRSKKY